MKKSEGEEERGRLKDYLSIIYLSIYLDRDRDRWWEAGRLKMQAHRRHQGRPMVLATPRAGH